MIEFPKKLLLTLLCAAQVFSFAACSKNPENAPGPATSAASPTETQTPETTVDIYADVPNEDLKGTTFSLLSQNIGWAQCPIAIEELNGEVLNDAVFERNASVENKLNIELDITIGEEYSAYTTVRNLVLANDSMYDLNCLGAFRIGPMLSQHLFADLKALDDVHLSEPWYNRRSQEEFTIRGQVCMTQGVAQIEYFEGVWVIYFNKKLIADNKMEDPYELVRSGKWTIDRFSEMANAGAKDLNADGVIDTNDVFGFSTHTGITFSFLHGCEERAITQDETGTPVVVVPDNRMIDAMEKIQKLMSSKNFRTLNDGTKNKVFASDQALFLGETLGSATKLREMVTDFGIIPSPKYDESQKEYLSYMAPSGLAFCIPVSAKDLRKSAVVLENLNALSYETVLPAYYDVVLGGKALRDEISLEVLDLVVKNCENELAYVFMWNSYYQTVLNLMAGTSPIASTLEKEKTATESAIARFMEEMSKN